MVHLVLKVGALYRAPLKGIEGHVRAIINYFGSTVLREFLRALPRAPSIPPSVPLLRGPYGRHLIVFGLFQGAFFGVLVCR